jgi:hypothetical protein
MKAAWNREVYDECYARNKINWIAWMKAAI